MVDPQRLRDELRRVKQMMASGTIVSRPIGVLTAVLRGAINEAAMVVAEAPDSDEIRRETGELLNTLIDGLKT